MDLFIRRNNTGKIDIETKLGIKNTEKIAESSKTEQNLIFVRTKNEAERIAQQIAEDLPAS